MMFADDIALEYMCMNEDGGFLRFQGTEIENLDEFKYLGWTVQSNGECGREVKKRVQVVWSRWRGVRNDL